MVIWIGGYFTVSVYGSLDRGYFEVSVYGGPDREFIVFFTCQAICKRGQGCKAKGSSDC